MSDEYAGYEIGDVVVITTRDWCPYDRPLRHEFVVREPHATWHKPNSLNLVLDMAGHYDEHGNQMGWTHRNGGHGWNAPVEVVRLVRKAQFVIDEVPV